MTPVVGEETENGAEEMGSEGTPTPRCLLAPNPEVPKQEKHRAIGSDTEATVRHMLWPQSQHGHQQTTEGESPQ